MSVQSLLSNLSAQGVRLKFDAPIGALTPELRAELAACKAELLAILSKPAPKRPHFVRSCSGQLAACPFDNCGGKAEQVGVNVWQCAACGERFRVKRLDACEVELFDKWIN